MDTGYLTNEYDDFISKVDMVVIGLPLIVIVLGLVFGYFIYFSVASVVIFICSFAFKKMKETEFKDAFEFKLSKLRANESVIKEIKIKYEELK